MKTRKMVNQQGMITLQYKCWKTWDGLKILLEIINKIWSKEKITKDWKIGMILLTYKIETKHCNSYREIILLSTVLKYYEQILDALLTNVINATLSEAWSRFKKGRSAQDYIFTIRDF